jgi:hypothetical protein
MVLLTADADLLKAGAGVGPADFVKAGGPERHPPSSRPGGANPSR